MSVRSLLWTPVLIALAGCTGSIESSTAPGETPGSSPPGGTAPPGSTDAQLSGLEHWQAQCASCHGGFLGGSSISSGNSNGDFRLDVDSALAEHGSNLETYIADTMPLATPSSCVGDCASLTGSYIRSLQQSSAPIDCSGEADSYAPRSFKLLTSREYENALEDLFDLDGGAYGAALARADISRGGFLNMEGKGVTGTTLQSYTDNAEAIARWAVTAGLPFSCNENCGPRFVDEFLFKAFRGEVSDATRADYIELFERYPSDGMRLALEAALSSPFFLYRLEAGVPLQDALSAGYYTGQGEATLSAEVESLGPSDFQTSGGQQQDDAWALFENGGFGFQFSQPIGPRGAHLEIDVRGSNHGRIWPELTLQADGRTLETRTIDHADRRTQRFALDGVSGRLQFRIAFENDSGEAPYGPGQDANLFVHRVALMNEEEVQAPAPTESPLENVASDAYVLTPYELASTLSFMLTGSPPDASLLQAARADRLSTSEQIRAQAERLLASPRGQAHLGDFIVDWYHLGDVTTLNRPSVPEFDAEVKAAMLQELETHFRHVFFDESVPYRDFFAGEYTFLNRSLAEFYGIPGNFDDSFRQTPVSGRGGPIASGAFMAVNAHLERSSPIQRAVRTREAALCHYIDPPNSPLASDDIDEQRAHAQGRVAEAEQAQGGLSSRDFYFLYTDGIDACAGCHERIINPMFGMEDFDNVGRHRSVAGGMAVEALDGMEFPVSLQGTLYGIESPSDPNSLEFAGAKDLSNQIADTEAVKACLVRKSFRYFSGLPSSDRDLDTGARETLTPDQRTDFACASQRMRAAFDEGQDPKAMLLSLVTETMLRLRR